MEEKNHIAGTEQELNSLFKELLEGCKDDLEESKLNVEMFLEEIANQGQSGKERFGQLYNEALKIKGDARDRQLKLLNMFKDRVSTKEKNEMSKAEKIDSVGPLPSTHEMNQYIEEMEKARASNKPEVISLSTDLSKELSNQKAIQDSYQTINEDDDEDYELDFEDDETNWDEE